MQPPLMHEYKSLGIFFLLRQEITRLEAVLRESAGAETSRTRRETAEKTVGLELREENLKLTEERHTWEESRKTYEVLEKKISKKNPRFSFSFT